MNTVIFGGSFNPVHNGHVALARAAAAERWVDRLLILPDHLPPHKAVGADFASDRDRLVMCRLLAALVPKAEVCTEELDRGGTSYMYDTVTALASRCPEDRFYLLVGGDMALTVDTWYRGEELIRRCGVVTTTRGGYEKEAFCAAVKRLREKGCDLRLLAKQPPTVSSTEVREALAKGKADPLLPPSVLGYIRAHRLYEKENP